MSERQSDGAQVNKGKLIYDVEGNLKNDTVREVVKFRPDGGCPCKKVNFIQVVKKNKAGNDNVYPGDPKNGPADPKNAEYYKNLTSESGGRVDQIKGRTRPFYNDSDTKPTERAQMDDDPSVFPMNGKERSARFESCAVCVDTGEIFGCVDFEFSNNEKGDKIEISKPNITEKPSREWQDAVNKWNDFAKGQKDFESFPPSPINSPNK